MSRHGVDHYHGVFEKKDSFLQHLLTLEQYKSYSRTNGVVVSRKVNVARAALSVLAWVTAHGGHDNSRLIYILQ